MFNVFIMNIRFFSVFSFILVAHLGFAQVNPTFRFLDQQGNEVPDGSTITIRDITLDEWDGETEMMVIPLSIENVSGQEAAAAIYEVIDDMPSGSWQTCALGNCRVLTQTGYSQKSIAEAGYLEPIDTEWFPNPGNYPVWEATLQIHVFNIVEETKFDVTQKVAGDMVIGHGPKIKVRFAYGEPETPTAIHGAEPHHTQRPAEWFDLSGRRLQGKQNGSLNIVRLPDGKVKTIAVQQ